jgi:hypothetical protein
MTIRPCFFRLKMVSKKNDFCILRYLVRCKITINGIYFPFDRKFFFNFRKWFTVFKNRKSFSDFEHLILKLTYPAKTRSGLDGTLSGLDRDPPET